MINIKNLKVEVKLMMDKLKAISKIKKLYGNGKDFVGLHFDENGITYKSETSTHGCGTEGYDFFVKWEDLNQPLEYFESIYENEILEHRELLDHEQTKANKEKERLEKVEYLRLKKKFEEISYFCLYDGKNYVGTGINSTSKKDCLNDGVEFYFSDVEDELYNNGLGLTDEEKESRLEGIGIVVHEHSEEM